MADNGNIVINENDINTLSEEFASSKTDIDAITTSMANMKECLTKQVYEGYWTHMIYSAFSDFDNASKNLAYIYNALDLFAQRMASTFKDTDTSASDDAKSGVAEVK